MYLRHYGFRDKPFKLAHDPAYYYAASHQVPLNELCYSIEERQGLAVLVGEAGTGKTTLLRRLLNSLGPHQRGVFMSDTSLVGQSLIRQLDAAVRVLATGSATGSSEPMKNLLTRDIDKTFVLLIDEAQGLTPEQLEDVRHLTNLEVPGRKLIEIIMAGQPPLENLLAKPQLISLHQRIAVRSRLEPLDLENTRAYIDHRLRIAGSLEPLLFAPEAIDAIHQSSKGIPRLINIICDRCLVVGYARDAQLIDLDKAAEAIEELRMEPGQEPEGPPAGEATGDGLMVKLNSRIEAIEEKLDVVVHMLAQAGLARPELADTTRTRQHLERLQRTQPYGDGPRRIATTDSEARVTPTPVSRFIATDSLVDEEPEEES